MLPARLTGLYAPQGFDVEVLGPRLSRLPLLRQAGSAPHVTLVSGPTGISSREGYTLVVDQAGVTIRSASDAGLFYGCQTLEQLIDDAAAHSIPIPYCSITDYPDMSYRAVHFDVKHHLDHLNRYYELVDRLARYKINGIIFEFEDKLRYKRQPLVGASHAITIEEMAALTRYARRRHIDISPLVQGLGHATFILKHEAYAHLREHPASFWAFCPADSGTYRVLNDLYLDAIEATPGSKYLHVGGDEIGNIGQCARCRPIFEKEGSLGLNLIWLNKVSEFLEKNGRTPIFWDDMPLKEINVFELTRDRKISAAETERRWNERIGGLEGIVRRFPENGIFMRWHYVDGALPGNMKVLEWYRQKKLNAMVAGATQYGDNLLFPPDNNQNTRSLYEQAVKNGIKGGVSTSWDDRSLHMETFRRGFIASAEYAWTAGRLPVEDFDHHFLWREFGVGMDNYAGFYAELKAGASFWNYAFLKTNSRTHGRNTMFPIRVDGYTADALTAIPDTNFLAKLIDLPQENRRGQWSLVKENERRITEAKRLLGQREHIRTQLDKLYRQSSQNRAHWDIFRQLYDFQLSAPELWVALHEWDTAADKQQPSRRIRILMDRFRKDWEALQDTYSKTRHLSYPADYLPDRYWQFASRREDHSWMILVEERMFQKLEQWLGDRR